MYHNLGFVNFSTLPGFIRMIGKEFNKVRPYCYVVTRLSDNKKYFGVRWANVKKRRTPINDFGKYYFSSQKEIRSEFKKDPKKFKFKLEATFSSIEEAREYEANKNKKLIKDPNWLNLQAFPAIINEINPNQGNKWSAEIRKKISDGIKKSFKSGRIHPHKGKTKEQIFSKEGLERIRKSSIKRWEKGLIKPPPPLPHGKEHPLFGKPLSKETKLKISLANTGKKASDIKKKKISAAQFNRIDHKKILFNGKKLKIYEFCKEIGITIPVYNSWRRKGYTHDEMSKIKYVDERNGFIWFKGEKITLSEFYKKSQIKAHNYFKWKKLGLTLDQMIERSKILETDPQYFNKQSKIKKIKYQGKIYNGINTFCKSFGIKRNSYDYGMKKNMSLDEIINKFKE